LIKKRTFVGSVSTEIYDDKLAVSSKSLGGHEKTAELLFSEEENIHRIGNAANSPPIIKRIVTMTFVDFL